MRMFSVHTYMCVSKHKPRLLITETINTIAIIISLSHIPGEDQDLYVDSSNHPELVVQACDLSYLETEAGTSNVQGRGWRG